MTLHPVPPLRASRRAQLTWLVVLAATTACSSEPSAYQGPTGREVMQSTIDHTVVPGFVAFREAAEGLRAGAEGFCEAPGWERLESLQGDWRALSTAWYAVAHYNIGPLDDDVVTPRILFIESMRQRGTDYTNTVREAYAAALGSGATIDAAYVESLSFNQVGLLALEVLIFEDGSASRSRVLEDIAEDYASEPRKCAYPRGVAERLAGDAVAVESGWTESFGGKGAFRDTMLGAALDDGREPVVGLLIALQKHLDYLRVRKLDAILDAQLSGHFYANVAAMLQALEDLLEQPTPESAVGIFDYMIARGLEGDVELVRANLAAARAAAATEDRAALSVAIGLLDGHMKREIPAGIGVDLGLNFSDGD